MVKMYVQADLYLSEGRFSQNNWWEMIQQNAIKVTYNIAADNKYNKWLLNAFKYNMCL